MVKIKILDSHKELNAAFRRLGNDVEDLTLPFQLITESWFKTNRAIFSLKSPGKYADLSPGYKVAKRRALGFVYPILKAKGRLSNSMVNKNAESITRIINKNTLVLGTKTPYAKFLQRGTGKMPARPVVIFGSEQVAPSDSGLNKRVELWIKMVSDFIDDKLETM